MAFPPGSREAPEEEAHTQVKPQTGAYPGGQGTGVAVIIARTQEPVGETE